MLSLLYCPSSILLPGTSEGKLYGSSMPHNKVRPWKTYRGCETGQFPRPFTIHGWLQSSVCWETPAQLLQDLLQVTACKACTTAFQGPGPTTAP